jgi:hypothetical protein
MLGSRIISLVYVAVTYRSLTWDKVPRAGIQELSYGLLGSPQPFGTSNAYDPARKVYVLVRA